MTCAATTFGSASWRMSLGRSSPMKRLTNTLCSDSMPPMPVPCVEEIAPGCTAWSSSAGLKPAERKASTAVTRFHAAIRSMEETMEAGIPQRVGSKLSGIWPATKRVSVALRGTRAVAPFALVTAHSPSSAGAMAVNCGSASRYSRAACSLATVKVISLSRNTSEASMEPLSCRKNLSESSRMPQWATTSSRKRS